MKKILLFCFIISVSLINAQTFVSTNPETKKVILEEYTGIHCPNCPDGHLKAQQLHDANPGEAFIICIHTGSYATPSAGEPDFRVDPIGSNLAGATNLAGYPAGAIN